MAIRVIEACAGCPPPAVCCVFDDRRHMYLDAEGQWQVVSAYFPSAGETEEALRTKSHNCELAIRQT